MSAKIVRAQRKALATARHCAREGNGWFARLWLDEANKAYPTSRRQRQQIARLLEKAAERK